MFGHDDSTKNDDDIDNMVTDEVVQEAAVVDDTTSPAYTPAPPLPDDTSTDATASTSPAEPATAAENISTGDVPPVTPAYEEPDSPSSTPIAPAADTTATDTLLGIKQDALQQLSPLVGHLNQTPEEKFRTTMMMIQASDNQALIKDAYAAAQAITDDKTRAQALLDIINEINYFTRQA